MSGFTDLGLGGPSGLLQLAVGGALFLLPGLAAVDRLLGLRPHGWMWAPVFSFTLLPLGAIVLDLFFALEVSPLTTVALAVGWTLVFGRRRLLALARGHRHPGEAQTRRDATATRRLAGRSRLFIPLVLLPLVAAIGLTVALQSTPHLPGDASDPLHAYPDLLGRVAGLFADRDFPYPVHVDEHHHLSQQAAIVREGHVDIDEPYTGLPNGRSLFSISGFRQERGFNLALVQLHDLTGLPLAAQARFLPALQAGYTAAVVYAAFAPGPGALAGAALVGVIPTTVRFLGPGFLVPSSFALPWILAGLHVSLTASGGRRLGALALVETGAFFMHLVPGVLTLVAATLAALGRPGRRSDRIALVGASLLPLVWLGPLVFEDAKAAVLGTHDLGFHPELVFSSGLPLLLLAVAGAALAFLWPLARRAHQVIAILAAGILATMALSVRFGHDNDATYGRLVPPLFLCIAILAGLAIGALAGGAASAWRRQARWPARSVPFVPLLAGGLLVLLAAAPAVAEHLSTPYYRVMDERSWRDAQVFEASGAGPEHRFLSDPWQAPLYNLATGARPHAVLIPGTGSAGGGDWESYVSSNGASQAWFDERGIDYVIGPGPPQADHERIGSRVYRIIHHDAEAQA